MDKLLESEIDAQITRRILAYHSQLIETGQIKAVELKGPSAIHPPSHYNQSAHMQKDVPSINPAPHQGEPIQSNLGVHEHE